MRIKTIRKKRDLKCDGTVLELLSLFVVDILFEKPNLDPLLSNNFSA